MDKRDITDSVERLEAFEDRLSVSLEGLFANIRSDHVFLNGELHPRDGTELNQDIEVVAIVYDSSGRVLAVQERGFYQDEFFGFEAFSFVLDLSGNEPAKVRVYPKAR